MNRLVRKENVWRLKVFIHDVFRKHGIKSLAVELHRNPKSLSNEINEYIEHQKPEMTLLYEFTSITKDYSIIDEFERLLGRIAINLRNYKKKNNNDLVSDLAGSLSSLGKLGEQINKARDPKSERGNSISGKEFDGISRVAYKHITIVLSLLDNIKKNVF